MMMAHTSFDKSKIIEDVCKQAGIFTITTYLFIHGYETMSNQHESMEQAVLYAQSHWSTHIIRDGIVMMQPK